MTSQPIQDLLDRAVAAGAAPGLTASVAGPDGRDAHYAAGVRGIADPRPMTPDSVFWIASCTKAITSAAALQLVERGLLDLDEPVGGRLPMLATPQVLEELDADGAARLRPARRPVTLRALLTHTSGLAYDFLHAGLARHYAATGDSLAGSLTTAPLLVFDPGDDWQYGVGIDVAGWLVEAASGQSLPDYFAQHIFGPLGMADTGFTPGAALSDRMVGMHSRGPDGTFEAASAFPSAPEMYGGGGLYSTAPDYLKFLRAVLADDGAGVLGPQALALLRQGDSRVGAAGHLITAAPPLSHDFRPMPDTPRSHTLGFLRNEADIPGRRRAGSLAWGGLANCYYWADPASGVAAMLCAQFLPFADPRMLEVFDAFEGAVYAA